MATKTFSLMRRISSRMVSMSAPLVLTGIGLVGCAQPPKEDLEQAKAALDNIKAAKADVYAPEAFKAAEDAYNFARVEIQEQEEKFALVRSYSHAEVLLTEATAMINDAKEEAETGREDARRDAETLIEEAKRSFGAAEDAVKRVPSRHREAAKSALEDAGALLFEAEKDFKDERFFEAGKKAEDAKARADEVTSIG